MKLICILIFSIATLCAEIPTPAEKSAFTRYTRNQDIACFLNEVAASSQASVEIIGETQTRAPIRMLSLFAGDTPDAAKPTIFLFSTQHGDEQSGTDALLALIREAALGDLQWTLNDINLLIVPAVNIDGMHANVRRNAQDLDLNRDHVKLESPETRALHRIFRRYLPHVTLDVHEKGPDYYLEQMGVVSNLNISTALHQFSRDSVLAGLSNRLKADNIPFHEYLIRQAIGFDYSIGADYSNEKKVNLCAMHAVVRPILTHTPMDMTTVMTILTSTMKR